MRGLAILLLLAACVARPAPIDEATVQTMLDQQRTAWNAGDMDAFMATYWDSPHLSFVSSTGISYGHGETRARYRRAYPNAAARGTLAFELLEVRPLGDGATALVIGRWSLDRAEPARGMFTLIVAHQPGGLRIVHDHSSPDA